MTKRMLIDDTCAEETRVVIVNGNKVEDVEFESTTRKQIKGNIYLAKVMRVEPSLQAAFVDYGGNKHGFLAFGEIHPDYYNLSKEELNEKVTKFLYDFSEKLQWSDEDRIIWRLRFIENIPPVQVAEECDRPRAWLDTRYSRLNQKFTTAIRKWWNINS